MQISNEDGREQQESVSQKDRKLHASSLKQALAVTTLGTLSLFGSSAATESDAPELREEVYPVRESVQEQQRSVNDHGATFAPQSQARKEHQEIEALRRQGRPVPDQKVARLFIAAAGESGTKLTPQFVRHYASRHKDSAEASAAILSFLKEVPYLKASETFLNQFWHHTEAEVLRNALLLSAENIQKEDRSALFQRLMQHEDQSVRSACVVAMLSKCAVPEGCSTADYVLAACQLPAEAHTSGNELRIAMAIKRSLQGHEHMPLNEEELEALKVPLLHALQRLEIRYPGLLASIDAKGEGCFDSFCGTLAGQILEHRTSAGAAVLFDKETKVYIALHYEEDFTPFPLKAYLESHGVSSIDCMKAGRPEHGDPGSRNPGGGSIPDSEERRKFLESLKALETATPKTDYIKQVRAFAENREEQAVVWNLMHGGPDHFWFYSGNPGAEVADDLEHPFAVSHKELATQLFMAQYEQIIAEGKEAGEIDLGHLTFILDSCRQYTVAEQCQIELVRLAAEHEVTLKSFPLFVSLNQRMMYGELNVVGYVHRDSSGRSYEIATSVKSPFNIGLESQVAEDGQLFVKHLYPVERGIAGKIENYMKDSDRLAPLRAWNKRDERDEKGLRGFGSQDPALFDARGWDLDEVLRESEKRLQDYYPEFSLPASLAPKAGTEAHRRLLEIANASRQFSDSLA